MPKRNSTTSIGSQENFFTGVLPAGSTTLWFQSPSEEEIETTEVDHGVRLFVEHDGLQVTHDVSFHLSDRVVITPQIIDTLRLRIGSHLMINLVPNQGLPELLESMKDIIEYHMQLRPSQTLLLAKETLKAHVRGEYNRPSFHAVED